MNNMYDIINKKRYKQSLTKSEIDYFVEGYVKNAIPDYQVASLLMAICCNGMNDEELTNLTMAMANSGDKLDLSSVNGVTVDKHSTGGVGDKTTLIVAPMAAALGCKVAKMSGRALGFTGGTADKLEAIDGYKLNIPEKEFISQVNKIGLGLISTSGNLAPADKKIYALRDVTATVESVHLIASSIMSKKIAAGSKCIVLDVKMGSGAFMKTLSQATELAQKMVTIGKGANREMLAVITNMDIPLGNEIGNILEVKEAIETLQGKGPKDLEVLCIKLAAYMLMLCSKKSEKECEELAKQTIQNGTAFEKFKQLVIAQGGNVKLIENPSLFKKSEYNLDVKINETGYISKMQTEIIGKVSGELGAGRKTKQDKIDYTAGITINKKTGDFVKQGETIAVLHTSKKETLKEAEGLYLSAIQISKTAPKQEPLIYKIIK